MNENVSANKFKYNHQLDSLERLATLKTKSKSNIRVIQVALGIIEYITYLVTFVLLFNFKVLPDYPNATKSRYWEWPDKIPIFQDYALFIGFFLAIYFLSIYQKQFYSMNQERNLSDEIIIIGRTMALCFLVTIGLTFIIKNTMVYSRILFLLFFATTFIEASGFRYFRKWTYYQLKRQGKLKQTVLVIGAGRVGQQMQQLFMRSETHGYYFVGFLDDQMKAENVLGSIDELERVVHTHSIDILYITIPSEKKTIDSLLQRIYKYQIDIRIIPELYDRMISVYEYRQDNGFPCLQIVKTPLRGLNLVIKRFMDFTLSLIGTIAISPLLLIIAVAIKTTSAGPVIFKQKRLGMNGVPFMMYKFRSMVIDAESRVVDLKSRNEMKGPGPVFKIKQDPRITKVGAFLRKYSLDELPQLINVLRGDMSLIGPRPPLPSEVEQYSDLHWRRMDVRPGMTGLWQVSGRSDLTFEEWIDLDIQYIERWSIGLEFKILLKTIPVVLKGKGAY